VKEEGEGWRQNNVYKLAAMRASQREGERECVSVSGMTAEKKRMRSGLSFGSIDGGREGGREGGEGERYKNSSSSN